MNNPYKSPASPVEVNTQKGTRPSSVYFITLIIIVFLVIDAVLAYLGDQEGEWVIVAALSGALLIIPWAIFVGKNWAPSTGMAIAIIITVLNLGGFYEQSATFPKLQKYVFIIEGITYIGVALILYRLKEHDFFRS